LHYSAAAAGNMSLVDVLLSAGAQLETKDNIGRTPFFYAMEEPSLETHAHSHKPHFCLSQRLT
jgi:hypothetical protein